MVVVCAGLGIAVYAIGLYLMVCLGFMWGLLYAGYCLWVEWHVLRGSCRHCYYFGKRCAFGKGRLCAWFFAEPTEHGDATQPVNPPEDGCGYLLKRKLTRS